MGDDTLALYEQMLTEKKLITLMNLMIVDEELIAGGVEAIQLNVIPELCSQVEEVYWLLPPAVLTIFGRGCR